jgi:hypothetical protein
MREDERHGMPIKLQGSVAFEPEFVGHLTLLTRTLIARGIDPDGVTIAKDTACAPPLPFAGPLCYDYHVVTGEDEFVVTGAGDARVLEALLQRFDEPDGAVPALQDGVFARLTRWMSPPA